MRILAVGGGSGGHVTPVIAVLTEIRKSHPNAQLRFWCDFKFYNQARGLVQAFDPNLKTNRIVAGKLRRYYHLSLWQQLTWPQLVFLNLRDIFLVIVGFIQSLFMLVFWRPDVVFTKGGYVCLPVGYAARILGIPLVIHDSDAHPGLTNRLLSKFAKDIGTGAPLEYYNYPSEKTKYVGIPISAEFKRVSKSKQKALKYEWAVSDDKPLLLITGGGLGATRINDAVVKNLDKFLKHFNLVLISGSFQYDELKSLTPRNDKYFQLYPFVSEGMPKLMASADIVVTRAGATSILELAALAKPTVIVPNGRLTGGHQLKNAKVYKDAEAVVVVEEGEMELDPNLLLDECVKLASDTERMKELGDRFHAFAKINAAKDMAEMIVKATKA